MYNFKFLVLVSFFSSMFANAALAKPIVSWIQENWVCESTQKSRDLDVNMNLSLWYPEGNVTVLNWSLEICGEKDEAGCSIAQNLYPAKLLEKGISKKAWPLSRRALFQGQVNESQDYYFRVTKGPSKKDRSLKGYIFLRELDETTNTRPIKKLFLVQCR